MAFMMLVGLVMTNGITSEAYWYNSEGERYPNVGYRTHVQSKGWERKLTLNGRTSGTVGAGKRLEAIQIIIMPKTDYPTDYEGFDGTIGGGFVDMGKNPTTNGSGAVSYMTHVQSFGNQKWVSDGSISGTSGEGN